MISALPPTPNGEEAAEKRDDAQDRQRRSHAVHVAAIHLSERIANEDRLFKLADDIEHYIRTGEHRR